MSIQHMLVEKIRTMVGIPNGAPFNPVAALDHIAQRVVQMHAVTVALAADRELLRQTLCAVAWDYGQYDTHLPDLLLLQWPADPEPPKPEEKKRIIEPEKGLVTLH